jgi:hypothetical protein
MIGIIVPVHVLKATIIGASGVYQYFIVVE